MPQIVVGEVGVVYGGYFEAGLRIACQKGRTEAGVGELKTGRALGQQGELGPEIGCMRSMLSLGLGGLEKGVKRSKESWEW